MGDDRILISTKQATALLGCNQSTLWRWQKLGASAAVIKRNVWDLKPLLDWWLNNIYTGKGSVEDNPTLQEERLRYEKARADKMELQVSQFRGDHLQTSAVMQAVDEIIAIGRRGMMLAPKVIPAMLYGQTEAEMKDRLERFVTQLLEDMARGATEEEITRKAKGIGAQAKS
jgi:predicted site-specific integrase-resolvase